MNLKHLKHIGDGTLLHLYDSYCLKFRRIVCIINNLQLRMFANRIEKRIERQLQSELNIPQLISKLHELIPQETRKWLLKKSSHRSNILESAQSILNGKYSIFEMNDLVLTVPDWNMDYRSGYRWPPGKFCCDYKVVNLENDADPKVAWELNRFHHFYIVGQAYMATGDEVYAEFIVNQIVSWIENNPFARSMNWSYPMEVSIRSVNWIWALSMISEHFVSDSDVLPQILSSLYLHGVLIYRYPSPTKFNMHNHYLSNMVGEIYLGFLFSNNEFAREWLEHGRKGLYAEIRMQILPSGPDYERSISYHRLVLELVVSGILILCRANEYVPSDILFRIEKMFDFVDAYIMPNGDVPVIGDWDNGILHKFTIRSITDHSYLLDIRDKLFLKRGSCEKRSLDCADTRFLLPDNIRYISSSISNTQNTGTHSFSDAGFYIIHTTDLYCFINMSGKGRYPDVGKAGTHTHSDVLSFILCYDNISFLIDPGSYAYSGNPDLRTNFRSTSMHNTLTIDEQNQHIISRDDLWNFEGRTCPKLLRLEESAKEIVIEGEHKGYQYLSSPVIHRRTFVVSRTKPRMKISDLLIGEGSHQVDIHFHFAEDIELIYKLGEIRAVHQSGRELILTWSCEDTLEAELSDGWISPSYGKRLKARILKITGVLQLPSRVEIFMDCSNTVSKKN